MKVGLLVTIAGILAVPVWGENQTISGYLVDKACSAELSAKGQKALAGHGRSCASMPVCRRTGFGVVTADGGFVAFDAAGSQKAFAAMKASAKDDDYRVTVTGDRQGSTIKVASLKLE